MSLEALTKEQMADLEQVLLKQIPDTESIGNVTLKSELTHLGWDDERYWAIRNRLIDQGLLQKGKGKGGSVKKVLVESSAVSTQVAMPAPLDAFKEAHLYEPMARVLEERWAKDFRIDDKVVEITATAGSKITGGKWSRPDITIGAYRTFPYLPGKFFDVIVFEVKPSWSIDVTAVYEALSHRRAAHRAYVLLHVPLDRAAELEATLEQIASEAKKFGVGVITAGEPDEYDTWDEIVEAVRHDPDPERVNDFLAQQLPQSFLDRIMKWFR